jgi:hypothetical protein
MPPMRLRGSIQKVGQTCQGDDTDNQPWVRWVVSVLAYITDQILPPSLTIQILTRNIDKRRPRNQVRTCLSKSIKVVKSSPLSFLFSLIDCISGPIGALIISGDFQEVHTAQGEAKPVLSRSSGNSLPTIATLTPFSTNSIATESPRTVQSADPTRKSYFLTRAQRHRICP